MNIAFRNTLTVPEYLAWAATQDGKVRTELIDGQIIPMSPELIVHNRLKLRLHMAFDMALAASGLEGEALIDGVAVAIDAKTAYQPDALVYLGAAIPGNERLVASPLVVAEILSPSTAHVDKGEKLAGYFKLASVMHYLVIDPDAMSLTHHRRQPDGSIAASVHADGTLTLDPPGLVLDLDTLFRKPRAT